MLSICMPLPRLSVIIFIPCYRAAIKYKCFVTCNCFSFFPSFHFNVLALTYFHSFFSPSSAFRVYLKPASPSLSLSLSGCLLCFWFLSSFFVCVYFMCICIYKSVYDFVHIHHHKKMAHAIYLVLFMPNQRAAANILYFMYAFFSSLSSLTKNINNNDNNLLLNK